MRAKAEIRFLDLKADVVREAGETFECSEERFGEIDMKLPGYVSKVAEPRKRAKATKEA